MRSPNGRENNEWPSLLYKWKEVNFAEKELTFTTLRGMCNVFFS